MGAPPGEPSVAMTRDPDRDTTWIDDQLAQIEPPDDPYLVTDHPTETDRLTRFDRMVADQVLGMRARAAAQEIVRQDHREPSQPFDAGTLGEVLARPPAPAERVQGLIPWEASTLLTAQRKCGKTTLVLNLARALLTGEQFLGQLPVRPVAGSVSMLNFEVSAAQLARWAADLEIDPERMFLVNLRGRRNPLGHEDDRKALASLLRARQTETMIVDPFGRAYTGTSQNDAGEVGAYLAELDQFARAEVGAKDLILTAHAGWNGERTRGSTALEDWADSIITLTRDDSDDGTGERYLRAIGRDIDLDEDRLDFDPGQRRLSLAGAGSRKQRKAIQHHDQLDQAVLTVISANPGVNGSQLATLVRETGIGFQGGQERHAAARLVEAGKVRVEVGKRGAKHYFAADLSRPLPTSPDVTPGTSPDLSLYGRGPVGTGQNTTSPEPCEQCGQPMTVVEPGQTTHPGCEVIA